MIINRFHSYLLSVTVSVITIKGTESRLLELGRIADITGGQVDLPTSLVSLIPRSYIYRRRVLFLLLRGLGMRLNSYLTGMFTAVVHSLSTGECG